MAIEIVYTTEQSRRHCGDQALRAARFVIKGRPEGEEPLWERDGWVYKESEAIKLIETEQ